jgi:hypothetical protein
MKEGFELTLTAFQARSEEVKENRLMAFQSKSPLKKRRRVDEKKVCDL